LKILHVSPYFMPARAYGGRVESLYRLCLNLARLGCEVRVLATNGDGPGKVLEVQTGRQIAVAAGFEVTYLGRLARHAAVGGTLTRIAIERAEPIGQMTTWRPALPVTQWVWVKP